MMARTVEQARADRKALDRLASRLYKLADAVMLVGAGYDEAAGAIDAGMTPHMDAILLRPSECAALCRAYNNLCEE